MLFNTIAEVKSFLPIGAGNDFSRLMPHIENAENRFIKPLLSSALYDELTEFYEADTPAEPTEVQRATATLLKKIQHATIHLAYGIGFDFLNVSVSDAGFMRTETQSQKGLFKYQEDNLKTYFSDAGFNALDDALVFIEDNIQHFQKFKATPNWTVLKTSFLPTVKSVEEIPYNIHGSRLIFLSLKPHIAFIEETVIQFALGQEIFKEVKTEMAKDAPAPETLAVLPYIRKPLIYLATANFIEESGAELTDKGLFYSSIQPVASGQNTQKKEPSAEPRILAMIARNQKMGNAYLDMLKSYLSQHWEGFFGVENSAITRDNTAKKTFFA